VNHLQRKKKIIFIHDTETGAFPNPETLSSELLNKNIFAEIAIPLVYEYSLKCWERILHNIEIWKQPKVEDISTDIFLSHKQTTGQKIAHAIYGILAERYKLKVFQDVRTLFHLHDLPQLVSKTNIFVFILSEEIFDSYWCRQEFEAAINSNRKIVIVKDQKFKFTYIPEEWKKISRCQNLFYSEDVITFSDNYIDNVVERIIAKKVI